MRTKKGKEENKTLKKIKEIIPALLTTNFSKTSL